jgi:DNA (cytosine-5)-methyltransferase 1
MTSYYNEIDPFAAQWLRNLILAGHLPRGDVDERSITEVSPDDLRPYTQCHFFAGIGGWSLALKLAHWPDDRPVWTGSCPCQPFSAAGENKGQADERHLWPAWKDLIAKRRPPAVFGEQVASAIAHGWLDEVGVDLEDQGYAVAAAIIPACAAGAFHRRDRLWFVADANGTERRPPTEGRRDDADWSEAGWSQGPGRSELHGPDDVEWLRCPDGKARAVKPGIRLLAHGIPGRVGRLRAYGNAIVPQVAAAFIEAFDFVIHERP